MGLIGGSGEGISMVTDLVGVVICVQSIQLVCCMGTI